jgi:cardiolipin synthase A/B
VKQFVRTTGLPAFSGGNQTRLLCGGDALFPAMAQAIATARDEIILATYIYSNRGLVQQVTKSLVEAAQRGVKVHVVVDGFGARTDIAELRAVLQNSGVQLRIFRPMQRWWNWFEPQQLRRLHQKICTVDEAIAFVGGINLIDDRFDQVHGWSETPRLDFAVQLRGPEVWPVKQAGTSLWARSQAPGRTIRQAKHWLSILRSKSITSSNTDPVHAAFIIRDNLRKRRAIERSYIFAMRNARQRIDLVSPYFYPGRAFRRVLLQAAQRGVKVRLLLQGKIDYRMAAWAAQALFEELLVKGVEIFEYTPAFLHAKVAVVDSSWATVGSSNMDPLSLLLNLEANLVVSDTLFTAALACEIETALAASRHVERSKANYPSGWRGTLRRAWIGWCARVYLHIAGAVGRY